jgi:hypothetical protein
MGRPDSNYREQGKVRPGTPKSGTTEQQVVFVVGPPTRPNITHDDTLGACPRREPTAGDHWDNMRWRGRLSDGKIADFLGIRNLPDALPAYEHYLDGKGADRWLNYARFLNKDDSGAVVYLYARLLARQAAEQLYRDKYEAGIKSGGGTGFQMTGGKIAVGGKDGRFPYPDTENWQKTLGAHFIWISANVTVRVPADTRVPEFVMWWTIHAEDKYNFNPGQKDIASGAPDDENWMFECVGLGKSYMHYGMTTNLEVWTGATRDVTQVMHDIPGTW